MSPLSIDDDEAAQNSVWPRTSSALLEKLENLPALKHQPTVADLVSDEKRYELARILGMQEIVATMRRWQGKAAKGE